MGTSGVRYTLGGPDVSRAKSAIGYNVEEPRTMIFFSRQADRPAYLYQSCIRKVILEPYLLGYASDSLEVGFITIVDAEQSKKGKSCSYS